MFKDKSYKWRTNSLFRLFGWEHLVGILHVDSGRGINSLTSWFCNKGLSLSYVLVQMQSWSESFTSSGHQFLIEYLSVILALQQRPTVQFVSIVTSFNSNNVMVWHLNCMHQRMLECVAQVWDWIDLSFISLCLQDRSSFDARGKNRIKENWKRDDVS